MAMYAFADDSGSEPSQPLYVLGGLIMPEEQWATFRADWISVLSADPPIEYFKASEVWDKTKGPFAKLSTKQRSDKVDALADVIFTYRPLATSTRVRWDEFNLFSAEYQLDEEFNDPYFFLFFAFISRVVVLALDDERYAGANFVFDDQGRVGDRARLWWMVFWRYCGPHLRSRLGHPPSADDEKKRVELQAADMFAWYQRRSALGTLGHESHQRIWHRFKDFQMTTTMHPNNLRKIATNLHFPQKETRPRR